jgi:tetratricopeptide (TPR) repeat protein
MLSIKDIYIEMGDPNGYLAYANQYPGSKVTVTAQDSLIYLAAEGQFEKGNTDKALQGFNDYILRFPNGFFALQSHFFRGECLFTKQDFTNALADYQYVMQQGQSRFTERATARAANINYYDMKDNQQAYALYKKLEGIATLDENKRESAIGLMRTTFFLKKYSECVDYINKVALLPALPDLYKSEMSFYKGMSQFNLNDYDNALKELAYVIKNANNEQAAQAKYTTAKIYFLKKNYKQSEKECMEYTDAFPSYEYYLGKTYLLLADIYINNNNLLQAKATLQSLLDNYTTQDDVRSEGEEKLAEVQAKEMDNSNLKLNNNEQEMQFENNKQ